MISSCDGKERKLICKSCVVEPMNSEQVRLAVNTSIKETLLKRFQNLRYRRAFANANVGAHLAGQLQALRRSRKLSQEKMAIDSGIAQGRISLMERPDYQSYNIKTLQKLAAFFDVVFVGDFITYKELAERLANQSLRCAQRDPCLDDEEKTAIVRALLR
jgi:transcriptional regulator with XRE-family HTH domain